MRNAILTILATAALSAPLAAQSAAPTAYDEVTVRLSSPTQSTEVRRDQTSLHATGWPIASMLEFAYGINPKLIFGLPPELAQARYDINGTLTRPAGRNSSTIMRSLLATQFGLVARVEHREFPVYVLTVAEGGALFESVPPTMSSTSRTEGHLISTAATMTQIDNTLDEVLDRPIRDLTGLTLTYSVDLHFDTPATTAAARFAAVSKALHDQLGLDLKPATGPVRVLVIDKIDTKGITTQASLH